MACSANSGMLCGCTTNTYRNTQVPTVTRTQTDQSTKVMEVISDNRLLKVPQRSLMGNNKAFCAPV